MYVKLDVTQPLLEDFLTKTARKAKWGPNAVVNGEGVIIDARVKQGLRGSPVTRDLTWGVKAPLVNGKDEDGVSGKVLCKLMAIDWSFFLAGADASHSSDVDVWVSFMWTF